MVENIGIPLSIAQRESYKHKYSLSETYRTYMKIPDALGKFVRNRKTKIVDPDFIERLQLAVTEVNGCAVCSYVHAQIALDLGMSNEEIFSFLSGNNQFIKPEESKAILFAQHFADSGGIPEKQSFDTIVREYGRERAVIMLSAIQLMMAGNVSGIPKSAYKSRMKGKPYKDSSLMYEIGMQISIVILPFAILHGAIKRMLGMSNQKFV